MIVIDDMQEYLVKTSYSRKAMTRSYQINKYFNIFIEIISWNWNSIHIEFCQGFHTKKKKPCYSQPAKNSEEYLVAWKFYGN